MVRAFDSSFSCIFKLLCSSARTSPICFIRSFDGRVGNLIGKAHHTHRSLFDTHLRRWCDNVEHSPAIQMLANASDVVALVFASARRSGVAGYREDLRSCQHLATPFVASFSHSRRMFCFAAALHTLKSNLLHCNLHCSMLYGLEEVEKKQANCPPSISSNGRSRAELKTYR